MKLMIILSILSIGLVQAANKTTAQNESSDVYRENEQSPATDIPPEVFNTSPTPVPTQDEKGTLVSPEDMQEQQAPAKNKNNYLKKKKTIKKDSHGNQS